MSLSGLARQSMLCIFFWPSILAQNDFRRFALAGDFLAALALTGGLRFAPSVRLKWARPLAFRPPSLAWYFLATPSATGLMPVCSAPGCKLFKSSAYAAV